MADPQLNYALILELDETINHLIENVREQIGGSLCNQALQSTRQALIFCQSPDWRDKRKSLPNLFNDLLYFYSGATALLDVIPEQIPNLRGTTLENYEACLCLLNQLDIVALHHQSGFIVAGVSEEPFLHPLLVEITRDIDLIREIGAAAYQAMPEDSSNAREIKGDVMQLPRILDQAITDPLDIFLRNEDAARALEEKQEMVARIANNLEPEMGPRALQTLLWRIDNADTSENTASTLGYVKEIALHMQQFLHMLTLHAKPDIQNDLKKRFNYAPLLSEEYPAYNSVSALRREALHLAINMHQIVDTFLNKRLKNAWQDSALQLNDAANHLTPDISSRTVLENVVSGIQDMICNKAGLDQVTNESFLARLSALSRGLKEENTRE